MSCVVGLVHNKKVYMGSDVFAVDGRSSLVRTRKDSKIFINGDYLFGFCGLIRVCQILSSRFWTPPKRHEKLIDSIRDQVKRKGCLSYEDDVDKFESNILVGYKGQLFEIHTDFQLAQYEDDYSAIGEGKSYALGSFYETEEIKNEIIPGERVRRALKCATYFLYGSEGKVNILSL